MRDSLVLWLLAMGAALAAFDLASSKSQVVQRGFGKMDVLPIYGFLRPGFSKWGAISIALACLGAGGAWAIARVGQPRAAWVLPICIGFMLAFTASVAIAKGNPDGFAYPFLHQKPSIVADYQADAHYVSELGISKFVRTFPQLAALGKSPHIKTHPPGPVVFVSLLQSMSPQHIIPRALALAFLSVLILVPTWFIAMRFGDRRVATYAVMMLAVAPAAGVFVFDSMDAVYATLLAGCAALLVWGLGKEGKPWLAFLGGVALGLASFMTYAVLFIAAFALLYAFMTGPARRAVGSLALAGAGGLLALALLRVTLGYSFFTCIKASYSIVPRTDRATLYWVFGNPAVWLTFAGLPMAVLGVKELIFKRPRYFIAFLIPLLIADLTWIFPGETERIGQFAYPFLAVAAGVALVRWESQRRRPWVVGALVLMAAAQTILLEALVYTFW